MSIPNEMSALATVLSGITLPVSPTLPTIKKVYTVPPMSPPTTEDLPCFIIFIRKPIQIGIMTFGNEQRTTEYVIQFIYAPMGQGTFEDVYTNTLYYIDPVMDALWSHMQLNGTTGVNWSLPQQSLMPGKLRENWGGQEYFGIDFAVQVTSTREVTIGV